MPGQAIRRLRSDRAEGLQGGYDLNFGANTAAASGDIEALGAQIDDLTDRVCDLRIGATTGDSSDTIASLNAEMDTPRSGRSQPSVSRASRSARRRAAPARARQRR
jgi:hypothetical protein